MSLVLFSQAFRSDIDEKVLGEMVEDQNMNGS